MKGTISFLLMSIFIGSSALAGDLSPVELYTKCYSKLTNHPVDIDSQTYRDVESGKANPIEKCIETLNSAMFANFSGVKQLRDTTDPVQIAILHNFQSFHRSWFSAMGPINSNRTITLMAFLDYETPALYLTDALFGNQPYSSIFTRSGHIEGVRQSPANNRYTLEGMFVSSRTLIVGPTDDAEEGESTVAKRLISSVGSERIPLGYLVGLKNTPAVNVTSTVRSRYKSPIVETDWPSAREDDATDNITRHFGGGILGSQPYIIANAESLGRLDGGTLVYRRMANNTMIDLLCLDMPNLKPDQVDAYLQKYSGSDLSFRQDRSCAQCHATLDPFANAFRNVQGHSTASNTFVREVNDMNYPEFPNAFGFEYLRLFKVRTNTQVTIDSDTSYKRRRPEGQLYYNSVDGRVINLNVNGIADMGNKIANQLDPYVCAAQRYYGFLTGVNISVNSGEDTEFYKKHREEIMSLGKELKSTGSLNKLVESILNTDAFQTRFPGAELRDGEAQ